MIINTFLNYYQSPYPFSFFLSQFSPPQLQHSSLSFVSLVAVVVVFVSLFLTSLPAPRNTFRGCRSGEIVGARVVCVSKMGINVTWLTEYHVTCTSRDSDQLVFTHHFCCVVMLLWCGYNGLTSPYNHMHMQPMQYRMIWFVLRELSDRG